MIDEEVQSNVEVKPFRFTILHAVGLMVLFVTVQLWVSFLLSKSGVAGFTESDSWMHIALANGTSGLLTAAAGALLAGFTAESILQSFRVKVSALLPIACCAIGMAILSSELANLLQAIQPISEEYSNLYDKLMGQNLVGLLFAIAMIAPLTEELIFRGIIQDGLLLSYRTQTAILTSAILFGLVHGLPWLMINAFLVGLFLSWLKMRTGLLGPGILVHAINNAIPFILVKVLSVEIPGLTTLTGEKVTFQPLWLDLLGFFLLVAGVMGILVLFKPAETEKAAPVVESAL